MFPHVFEIETSRTRLTTYTRQGNDPPRLRDPSNQASHQTPQAETPALKRSQCSSVMACMRYMYGGGGNHKSLRRYRLRSCPNNYGYNQKRYTQAIHLLRPPSHLRCPIGSMHVPIFPPVLEKHAVLCPLLGPRCRCLTLLLHLLHLHPLLLLHHHHLLLLLLGRCSSEVGGCGVIGRRKETHVCAGIA